MGTLKRRGLQGGGYYVPVAHNGEHMVCLEACCRCHLELCPRQQLSLILLIIIEMNCPSEERLFDKGSFDGSLNHDQGSLIEYDVSDALLGVSSRGRTSHQRPKSWTSWIADNSASILLTVALIVAAVESIYIVDIQRRANARFLGPTGLSHERTVSRTIYAHSKYMSDDEEVASKAWDEILAGHGVIALDADNVAEKNLPPSVPLPDDSGSFMYVIEAYHAMHCAKVIREHYILLEQGRAWNWSRSHDMHCFDALRQYIMCNIDDTILWTTGHRETGHGQEKKCNDWNALRDYAESESANYFDVEPEKGIMHLNNYHAGDGLTW
ncbi:hypothetical protein BU23DRAFT_554921 [Bimuria novae-zelandiae CBS 107.79]|uniref:Cyclochlorotine biosynthesis protein O n=1 Tax=Bimuria novae-zelandiae CBS 107.79 TaxID=1447943 RepID=A0A6A5V8W6_9PLEO|nr:hypothetical protein BU23DRAFT_554921 [Bimuria novae-zelandiae CBS 107.79]